MLLHDRLTVLDPVYYAREALTLFEKAQVSVDWTGERQISIAGYEGSIDFHTLVKSHLEPKLKSETFRASLSHRVDGSELIERIYSIFLSSHAEMENCMLVKYFEDRSKMNEAIETLEHIDTFLRDFSSKEFKKLFGSQQPEYLESNLSDPSGAQDLYRASKKQLRSLGGIV